MADRYHQYEPQLMFGFGTLNGDGLTGDVGAEFDADTDDGITDSSPFGFAVVPVVANRFGRNGEDVSAQIVTGEIPEVHTLTAFEQAQADWNGSGSFVGFDESPPELYSGLFSDDI